jgi:hypothetical protein
MQRMPDRPTTGSLLTRGVAPTEGRIRPPWPRPELQTRKRRLEPAR